MLLEHIFLAELEWRDLNPAGRALRSHAGKNRWVHFSQVNKIGVNALTSGPHKPGHSDPRGIYFFPVDWILENAETRTNYGTSGTHISTFSFAKYPHWFVCEVDLSGPGLVLSKVTEQNTVQMARKGGWEDFLAQYRAMPPDEAGYVVSSMHRTPPGKELWNLMKRLNQRSEDPLTWPQMLRGLTYILDDGTGSLLAQEPWQLLLLDPRRYRVIDSGSQPKPQKEIPTASDYSYWQHGMADLMTAVASHFGGKVVWRGDKRASYERDRIPKPAAEFSVGDRTFRLKVSVSMGVSLYLEYAYGRAVGAMPIRSEELLALSTEALVNRVINLVDEVMTYPSDLLFKPNMDEDDVIAFMEGAVGDGMSRYEWKTEIDNEDKRMMVTGTARFIRDEVEFTVRQSAFIREDEVSFSATISRFGKPTLDVNAGGYGEHYDRSNLPALLEQMASKFKDRVENFARELDPSRERHFTDTGPTLREPEYVPMLRGWMALRCGLRMVDAIERAMQSDVDAYRAYPDKDELHRDFAYVLKTRRW